MTDKERQPELLRGPYLRDLRKSGFCANEAFEEICRIEHVCEFDAERINELKIEVQREYDI